MDMSYVLPVSMRISTSVALELHALDRPLAGLVLAAGRARISSWVALCCQCDTLVLYPDVLVIKIDLLLLDHDSWCLPLQLLCTETVYFLPEDLAHVGLVSMSRLVVRWILSTTGRARYPPGVPSTLRLHMLLPSTGPTRASHGFHQRPGQHVLCLSSATRDCLSSLLSTVVVVCGYSRELLFNLFIDFVDHIGSVPDQRLLLARQMKVLIAQVVVILSAVFAISSAILDGVQLLLKVVERASPGRLS